MYNARMRFTDEFVERFARAESGYLLGMFAAFVVAGNVWDSTLLTLEWRIAGCVILILTGIILAFAWVVE